MRPRCAWAKNPLAIAYHDKEWGVPVRNDRKLFECLILEGAQAGLSWDTILAKRENYRRAFERFDFSETWTPVETVIDGNLAFQRGTFTVNARPKGEGDRVELRGSFLRIYQRQPDGEWRMTRDMFNSSTPPAQSLSTRP